MKARARKSILIASLTAVTAFVLLGQACGKGGSLTLARSSSSLGARACVLPAGVSGSPVSVEDVVAILNALPKPVSLPCFIESLDRPLRLFASQSSGSAQPSTGPDNPRFFLFSGLLIMTVTPDGPGANLLEMAVLKPGNTMSLKAELVFPITGAVSASAPYDRVRSGNGTSCRTCHTTEAVDPSIGFTLAYQSSAFRALPASEVTFAAARSQYDSCNPLAEPDRCELLKMIFGIGPAVRQDFPAGMPTP